MTHAMEAAGARFEGYVRAAMRERGIATVSELARETMIDRNTWYVWFRGERPPRRSTLVKASNVLGRSLDDLMEAWGGDGGPRSVTLSEGELRQLVLEAAEEGAASALRRAGIGRDE